MSESLTNRDHDDFAGTLRPAADDRTIPNLRMSLTNHLVLSGPEERDLLAILDEVELLRDESKPCPCPHCSGCICRSNVDCVNREEPPITIALQKERDLLGYMAADQEDKFKALRARAMDAEDELKAKLKGGCAEPGCENSVRARLPRYCTEHR